MIQESFNSIISANSTVLFQAKEQVRSSVDKELKTQIYSKLPTQESLKNQIVSKAQSVKSPQDIENFDNLYQKLINTHDSLSQTITKKTDQINSIKGKTQQIEENFNKLDNAVSFVNDNNLIPIAKGVITAAKFGLNALPINTPVGAPIPGSGGGAIIKLSDNIKKAEAKIKEFENVIKTSTDVNKFFTEEIAPINKDVEAALEILAQINQDIVNNKLYLETIYSFTLSYFTDLFEGEGINDDNRPEEDDLPLPSSEINSTLDKPFNTNMSIPSFPDDVGIELDDLLDELNPNISKNKIEYLGSQTKTDTGYQYKRN